jgi:hypothetical protein
MVAKKMSLILMPNAISYLKFGGKHLKTQLESEK